ncbi:MAG: hypothetical protein JW881_12055 [Spirochaetales bacterium]|nr:hypothetical protein [Spirochaetales bacterium]
MMLFGIIVGIVIGYIFKPQIDTVVVKAIRFIKDKQQKGNHDNENQNY